MNDYKLINSLLEDGSESSILKLKMIVDFNEFDGYTLITENNISYYSNNSYLIKDENIERFINLIENKEILDNFNFLRRYKYMFVDSLLQK